MDLAVNLLEDGDAFFDLLKAAIREWSDAPWAHERRRSQFALELYQRALDIYRQKVETMESRAGEGFNLETDRRLLQQMRCHLAHWEKKLSEVYPDTEESMACVRG